MAHVIDLDIEDLDENLAGRLVSVFNSVVIELFKFGPAFSKSLRTIFK